MDKSLEIRCVHRHTIEEHPACFTAGRVKHPFKDDREWERVLGAPWYTFPGYRIGYLDIETDALNANFGTMLTWCIKDKGGSVRYDVVKRKELMKGDADKRITQSLVDAMQEYKILVTYYGCVTPGHRVLKSDLTWVDVSTLVPGDRLLAFEDTPNDHRRGRRYVESIVIHNLPQIADVYKISLSDGTSIEATGDHPWLVMRKGSGWAWRTTLELEHFNCNNPTMTRVFDLWDTSYSREAGYLAGYYDSEGGIYQAIRKNRPDDYTLTIGSSQSSKHNQNIIDTVLENAASLGFNISCCSYDPRNEDQLSLDVRGRLADKLRFIGTVRPTKIRNLDINKLGQMRALKDVYITEIEYVGKRTVMGLGTTSSTYFVNGFPSHNTGFDVPFIRTKALYWNIDFPGFDYRQQSNGKYLNTAEIYHHDLYYTVKSKLKLSRNSLAVVTGYLGIEGKTPISPNVWRRAKYGDPKALAQVLEHNKGDVEILEKLHERLMPFRKWARKPI